MPAVDHHRPQQIPEVLHVARVLADQQRLHVVHDVTQCGAGQPRHAFTDAFDAVVGPDADQDRAVFLEDDWGDLVGARHGDGRRDLLFHRNGKRDRLDIGDFHRNRPVGDMAPSTPDGTSMILFAEATARWMACSRKFGTSWSSGPAPWGAVSRTRSRAAAITSPC